MEKYKELADSLYSPFDTKLINKVVWLELDYKDYNENVLNLRIEVSYKDKGFQKYITFCLDSVKYLKIPVLSTEGFRVENFTINEDYMDGTGNSIVSVSDELGFDCHCEKITFIQTRICLDILDP